MPGLFISYRREDSAGYAGRLFDMLIAEFGKENIFILETAFDYDKQRLLTRAARLAV